MSKTKSKDFYRKQHKLKKFKKKQAYTIKKIDKLIEDTVKHLDTPTSFAPPIETIERDK